MIYFLCSLLVIVVLQLHQLPGTTASVFVLPIQQQQQRQQKHPLFVRRHHRYHHHQGLQQQQRRRRPLLQALPPRPIDPSGWADNKFPAKDHCSKCGLCETSFVAHVKDACAFLDNDHYKMMSRLDHLEVQVHGRQRDLSSIVWNNKRNNKNDENDQNKQADEARFGVLLEDTQVQLVRGIGMPGAQWAGVVTSIAVAMLESNQVDAVVCIANADDDHDTASRSSSSWSSPEPILAKSVAQVLRGRGVKPALAPSLRVLDEIQNDPSIQRLLFCGVGCAVQAFRVIQPTLGLQQVYVLGTNCVDNSPTPEAADRFLRDGIGLEWDTHNSNSNSTSNQPAGYEFMADYRVHVKFTNGDYYTKPYFSLPPSMAEPSIAKSCLACFDYCNGLADVVVGYMGAPFGDVSKQKMTDSLQTITIRNPAGKQMVDTALRANRIELCGVAQASGPSHEPLAHATVESDTIVQRMLLVPNNNNDQPPSSSGGGMPVWIGNILATVLQRMGPKGIGFARYSIDYHILRNYLHLLDRFNGDEEKTMQSLPTFSRHIVDHYWKDSKNKAFASLRDGILTKHKGYR